MKINRLNKYQNCLIFIVLFLGIASRISQYIHNRSLWFDEALLALKLSNISIFQFFIPSLEISDSFLVNMQSAPPMFLMITKSLVLLFGNQELILRFLPFILSIVSIGLFYLLICKYIESFWAKILCLIIFSTSEILIYYSTEFKPYAVDAFVAITIHLIFFRLYKCTLHRSELFIWLIFCAFVVWVSFPSIFVLLGGIISLSLFALKEKKTKFYKNPIASVLLITLISFLACYYMYSNDYANIASLHNFWKSTFMPLSPFEKYGIPWYGIKWFYFTSIKIFKNPVGFYFPILGTLMSIMGAGYLFKKKYYYCLTIIIPVILTLGASSQGYYPFYGRMIIFLTPSLIIFIGCGFEFVFNRINIKRNIILGLLSILLVTPSIFQCVYLIFNPVKR